MPRLLPLVLVLIASALPPCAQDRAEADAFAEAAEALATEALDRVAVVPGLSLAVVRGGETVYAAGFGWADVEAGVAATADTPFYIASVTKPFTALATALLDREGPLDLDTSLAALFPDIAFDPAVRADAVTVRHLLSHTSGVENRPLAFRAAFTGEHTPAQMRRLLARSVVNDEAPLGTFDYTNVGYNILSLGLDDLGGGSWQALLAERVFEPVGMTHTTAVASEAAAWHPAAPYEAASGGAERIALVKHDDTMQAAGGMFASATDLARWLRVHLGEGRLDGRPVIPADVIAEVHRPVAEGRGDAFGPFGRDGYALGWHTGTYDGDPMLHHFGGFAGFHAHTSFMPGRDLGVVVLANEAGAGGRLATLLASFAYDWWEAAPEDRDAVVASAREAVDALDDRLAAALARDAEGRAERAERTWQLSLPRAAYAGTFQHPAYGTIVVEVADGELAARFGRLAAVATPYPEPESARVELIPGSGQVLRFRPDGGRVDALVWNGETFQRTGPN